VRSYAEPSSGRGELRLSIESRRAEQFLDHSSLAVTTTYLHRLEGREDQSWSKVAAAIGLE
jgi:hypothetical protein